MKKYSICYTWFFLWPILLTLSLYSCCEDPPECISSSCLNQGYCESDECQCPINVFGENCENKAPLGLKIDKLEVMQQPAYDIMNQNLPEFEFYYHAEIKTRARDEDISKASKRVTSNRNAPFEIRFTKSDLYFLEEARDFDLSSYLKNRVISIVILYRFTYWDRNQNRGGSGQGAVAPIDSWKLEEIFNPDQNTFTIEFTDTPSSGDPLPPLKYRLSGSWIY